jgi:predicted ester cyclase
MSETNKALARRWYEEVWNQKNSATIAELYHPQGRSRGLPDPSSSIDGPAAFLDMQRSFLGTFPDLHVTLETLVADGDWVAVRWTATMTHLGDGFGASATGKPLTMPGSSFMRFEHGQIMEGWNQMDFTRLRQQLQHR